jgi:hypothetical protein
MGNTMPKVSSDIAVIRTDISYIKKSIEDFNDWSNITEKRVTIVEQRVGVFAGINAALSILAGTIATYLGFRKG